VGWVYIIISPAGLWRAGGRAFKQNWQGKTLFNLTKVVLGMVADSAPDSPHAALLAAPLLDDLLSLDLELAPGGIASGDVVHGRSVAPPGCVYRQPLCS
jgi:hypothetical protein